MRLKFIGTNGSMGLRHGEIYEVSFKNTENHIILTIKTGLFNSVMCPYSSPQALAKNWSL